MVFFIFYEDKFNITSISKLIEKIKSTLNEQGTEINILTNDTDEEIIKSEEKFQKNWWS